MFSRQAHGDSNLAVDNLYLLKNNKITIAQKHYPKFQKINATTNKLIRLSQVKTKFCKMRANPSFSVMYMKDCNTCS
jgi:hypothetical protein